ncbi:STAS domain-containing protein [Aquabacterium sp.]|jgi:anti-anti-sigma factor|uniref:STAS domain-containing protein n=1 Tax=Aquabacterium sp. TaxID=1872578 RepID=UPI0025BCE984|nr:STAS domain-containing protein [Aquabacterium sp.]
MSEARTLPAELTIYTAAETHGVLMGWLAQDTSPGDWPVAADGVNQIDAAGLQLIVALHRSLDARGQHLLLQGPHEALLNAMRSLGMDALLHQVVREGSPA